MKQIFISFFNKKMPLLMAMCFLLTTSGVIAQVTATEDFDSETVGAPGFSESGINFTHTFGLVSLPGFGYNGSAQFLELFQPSNNFTTTANISINSSSSPGASFKINSFAAYVSSSQGGGTPFNGAVTVSGTPAGGGALVSATINIGSASGGLPAGQTRDGNGIVNGLNFTGTALDGIYFTSLTFSINDADGPGPGFGTRYLEVDHINFSTPALVTNQFSINDVSLAEGNSGTKLFTFTVTRSLNTAANSVQVQSANSSAIAGSDYLAVPLTTLSFTAGGALTQTISATVNGDVTIEGNETFFMNLSNATGGTIADAQGLGTIVEDDETGETFEDETVNTRVFTEAGFNFSSTGALLISRGNNIGSGSGTTSALDTRVGDGGSTGNVGSFSITNSGTSFFITSIDVWTSNNDGVSGTTGAVTVTFTGTKADGSGTASYVAPIAAISGFNFQTVSFAGTPLANVPLVSMSVILGAGVNYISLDNFKYGTASVSGTQVSVDDVSVLEGTGGSGTTTANFTVSRTNNTSAFTVNLASSNGTATAGTDYTAYNSTLSFTSGGALSQTVTVTILRDATIESNETFNMTLSGATNGTLYLKPVGVGTILDDDKVVETFEDEIDDATTFSENTVTFSTTGRFKVNISANSGSGSSKGYISSSPTGTSPNTTGSQGKIVITSPNKAFKLLQLDAWTATGTTPSFVAGQVTFTGTLFGGGTVTTTKTITPTNNTGTGWQQNITFTGTPLDNVLLTELEFIAVGTVTTVEIDNINYVAVSNESNATDYFRSRISGNWNDPNTWESSNAANFSTLVSPATLSPDFNANTITVRNTHTVTVPANVSIDQTTVDLGGTISVSSAVVLTINDGPGADIVVNGVVSGAGNMTIQSTSAGTASVGTSTGSITVNATVERFMAANTSAGRSGRVWRLLAAPLTAASAPTILNSWQEGGVASALGTHITQAGGVAANGFDASTIAVASSIRLFNTATGLFTTPANTNVTKVTDNGGAYFLFVRGNRNININSLTANSSTTLRMTGLVNTGAVTRGVNGTSFSLIPNPYPSPVDYEAMFTPNALTGTYYVWDANLGTAGAYRTIVRTAANTYQSTPTTGNATSDNLMRYIQSGQAFFIPGNKQIAFTEAMKTALVPTTNVFRTGTAEELTVDLKVKSGSESYVADGVRLKFNNGYSNAVDAEDVEKLSNFNENLGMGKSAHVLTVENRDLVDNADTIFLKLWNTEVKDYEFEITPFAINAPLLSAYLEDGWLGTSTAVSLSNSTLVPFSVTSDAASKNIDRFRIVFRTASTLPVTLSSLKAYQQASNIAVEWNVQNETAIKHYEVEKSVDGRTFSKASTQIATGNNMSSVNYKWLDVTPVSGDNFYRIRTVGLGGDVKYSSIAKVSIGKGKAEFAVYPNPLEGNVINLQFVNQPKGTYVVKLVNNLGQLMLIKQITHDQGSSTETIQLGATLQKGHYTLEMISPDKTKQSIKIVY